MQNGGMFLRCTQRNKDGKLHRYWSIVENRRSANRKVVQRQVLYLGEINDSQKAAWVRSIEVLESGRDPGHQVALFPEDREAPELAQEVVHVRLGQIRIQHARQWGGCWLACELWKQLQLDQFWQGRLGPSREGTDWLSMLKTLVSYRLLDPGSEWRLHREWYGHSAMGELLGQAGEGPALPSLYRCLDKLLAHKQALFGFLTERWRDLFQAGYDLLLYDLTSTYFEGVPPGGGKRRHGYTPRLPGIKGYLFPSEQMRLCRHVVGSTEKPPEGFLNYSEAASRLGSDSQVIRALVEHGILDGPGEYRCGHSKLVPASNIRLFSNQYVGVNALARHLHVTAKWLKGYLKKSVMP